MTDCLLQTPYGERETGIGKSGGFLGILDRFV